MIELDLRIADADWTAAIEHLPDICSAAVNAGAAISRASISAASVSSLWS